jgi:hypothetical protein
VPAAFAAPDQLVAGQLQSAHLGSIRPAPTDQAGNFGVLLRCRLLSQLLMIELISRTGGELDKSDGGRTSLLLGKDGLIRHTGAASCD